MEQTGPHELATGDGINNGDILLCNLETYELKDKLRSHSKLLQPEIYNPKFKSSKPYL